DIAVTGSQQALMLPAGLAFVAVSERAWQVIENNATPRFYLDLSAYRKSLGKQTTPYTPAVSLLFGLEEVLNLIEAQGMDNVIARHRLMMEMTRAGIRALGLPLVATDEAASPTVTSVYGTNDVHVEDLRQTLSAMNVTVAGGQQHLKGQIFRIGHMGYCEPGDILAVIATLEVALKTLNVPVSLGRGVQAAEEVWARV
ncbi:MAG: aminotransferase class V-fold PLP-dependent enzyme, partial [Novibacillus thermophilus]